MKTSKRKWDVMYENGGGVLKFASGAGLNAAIAKRLERRELFESLQGVGVQHVKDGKPLTAEGARLLGVAWPR